MKLFKAELALARRLGPRNAGKERTQPAVTSLSIFVGILLCLASVATAQTVQTNLAVTGRHAPSLNGNGRIEGSLQQWLGENATLNGGFTGTAAF